MILKIGQKKVQKMNASSEEAIVGAILEVANTDTKLIRKVVWDVVKSDLDKLAESTCGVEEKQLKFCEDAGLTITPNFRKTLLHVTNTLKNESHIMLFGEPITQKTMLWKTASAIKGKYYKCRGRKYIIIYPYNSNIILLYIFKRKHEISNQFYDCNV